MAKPAQRPATYDDLHRVPDHLVAEIVDGELFASPRPSPAHGWAADSILLRLRPAFGDGADVRDGWWFLHEPEIRLGREVLVPDIAAWRRSTLATLPMKGPIEVAPDWICEVLSPSNERYDRGVKLPAYARHGVSWAWVVDPIEQLIEVSRLKDGFWLNVATHTGDAVARMQPFDTLDIPLSRLWLTAPPAA